MTVSPPGWIEMSAIKGLPITTLAARSGNCTRRAWSMKTMIRSDQGIGGSGGSAAAGMATTIAMRAADRRCSRRNRARPRAPNAAINTLRHATRNSTTKGLHSTIPLERKLMKETQTGEPLGKRGLLRRRRRLRHGRLILEGISELRAEARRKFLVGDAVAVRQYAFRHVERAEDEIENREGRREVLLAAALGRGVMPAMENRRRDHIFKRPERPIEIGVDESRMRDRNR